MTILGRCTRGIVFMVEFDLTIDNDVFKKNIIRISFVTLQYHNERFFPILYIDKINLHISKNQN